MSTPDPLAEFGIDRPDTEAFVPEAAAPALPDAPAPDPHASHATGNVAEELPAEEPEPAAPVVTPVITPVAGAADPAAAAIVPVKDTPAPVERQVPLAAFLEERRTRDARIADLERQLAAAQKPPTPEVKADPDFQEDPKGYTDSKIDKALAELKSLKEEGSAELKQVRASADAVAFENAINSAEAAIRTERPDYMDALTHLRTIRVQQFALANPGADFEQIKGAVLAEERQMAATELKAGRNPYALAVKYAELTGFKPAAAPAAPVKGELKAPATPTAGKPNGASIPTVAPDATLTKSGGAVPEQDPDVEADPFDAALTERFGRRRA